MTFIRHLIRTALMCAVASLVLAGSQAWAGLTGAQADALQAKAAAGDRVALKTLMTEAQQGNPYAQLSLGVSYVQGRGVPQDYRQAAQWYRKAAQQGNAAAQNNLASLYIEGRGVPQDYGQAAQWYRRSAQQGYALAQSVLGALYLSGQGVAQDYGQAAQWFRQAAQQGNANALSNLGTLYSSGRGVPINKVAAYALFNLSAALDASSRNSNALRNRALRARSMSRQEIEAGQALTRQMSQPGNLLRALDQYVAHPAVKEGSRPARGLET